MKTFFFPGKPMTAEEWREIMTRLGAADGFAHGFSCAYDPVYDRITVSPGAVFFRGALHSLREELRLDYSRSAGMNAVDSVVLFADNDAGETRIEIIYDISTDSNVKPIPPTVNGNIAVYVLFSVVHTVSGKWTVDHRHDETINKRLFLRDDTPDLSGPDGISKGGIGANNMIDVAASLGAAQRNHVHSTLGNCYGDT